MAHSSANQITKSDNSSALETQLESSLVNKSLSQEQKEEFSQQHLLLGG